jgi:hypothetical protein
VAWNSRGEGDDALEAASGRGHVSAAGHPRRCILGAVAEGRRSVYHGSVFEDALDNEDVGLGCSGTLVLIKAVLKRGASQRRPAHAFVGLNARMHMSQNLPPRATKAQSDTIAVQRAYYISSNC